jgi:hypothetical protein
MNIIIIDVLISAANGFISYVLVRMHMSEETSILLGAVVAILSLLVLRTIKHKLKYLITIIWLPFALIRKHCCSGREENDDENKCCQNIQIQYNIDDPQEPIRTLSLHNFRYIVIRGLDVETGVNFIVPLTDVLLNQLLNDIANTTLPVRVSFSPCDVSEHNNFERTWQELHDLISNSNNPQFLSVSTEPENLYLLVSDNNEDEDLLVIFPGCAQRIVERRFSQDRLNLLDNDSYTLRNIFKI